MHVSQVCSMYLYTSNSRKAGECRKVVRKSLLRLVLSLMRAWIGSTREELWCHFRSMRFCRNLKGLGKQDWVSGSVSLMLGGGREQNVIKWGKWGKGTRNVPTWFRWPASKGMECMAYEGRRNLVITWLCSCLRKWAINSSKGGHQGQGGGEHSTCIIIVLPYVPSHLFLFIAICIHLLLFVLW